MSVTLADQFPLIPHDHSGECCGCVIPVDAGGGPVELRCNECGTVVGVINRGVLEDLLWLRNKAE